MPLVRTDAEARSHHGHLLTRTTSSSPAPSAFLGLIARAHVVRCRLVHRLMKSTHVHRASCACVACCRGVRHSVCLSVCHKSVLGPMSKLLNLRSRCIVAQLGNLGFGAKNLDEIQTRSLLTGNTKCRWAAGNCVIICVSQKRHKFGFLLPSHANRFQSFLVVCWPEYSVQEKR